MNIMALKDLILCWAYILVCACRGWLSRARRYLGWSFCDEDAIKSLYDAVDPSLITYSQVWEDAKTLRRALCLGPGDNVICVSSGGDNALALLLDNPDLVLAVDYSHAQVAVAELKRQAIKHLDYPTFMYFLGVGESNDKNLSRRQIYQTVLKPWLREKTLEFWENNEHFLDKGIIHVGVYEKYLSTFGRFVVPLVHSSETIRKLFEISPSEQAEYYDKVIDTWLWRFLARLYFGDVFVGRCPAFYERSNVHVGCHFLSRLRYVMCHVPAKENHYLEYVLTGELSGKFGLPEYMQVENFDLLKERVDSLVAVQGDILGVLERSESKFDAIDMSNIFDFVPMDTHKRYKKAAIARSNAGCRICHWTFVPVSDDRLDWKSFGDECAVDLETSRDLHKIERAWFYQTFIVQKMLPVEGVEMSNGRNGQVMNMHKNGVRKNGHVVH